MPKRTDINSILILGAGPIVIGQGCEFDYSGTQACKALREEGYRVILVNSNPATIMTDPQIADVTYMEPLRATVIEKIIELELPDAILPTMGGQTALNVVLELWQMGVLKKFNVEMIGANYEAIIKAEDRGAFISLVHKLGLHMPKSQMVCNLEEALAVLEKFGLPCIIRNSFSLGGSRSGIATNKDEFINICQYNFNLSSGNKILIDESIIGWKEFEMEVVRDSNDNCIIVCTIENLDPMGVHTGDSITVAPAQTLTDKEYQTMRDAAIAIIREVGIETGGSNVQFAVNPKNGDMIVIEMNPRVSRSSALASKATGFPIAKIAAKLAIGYTLDELRNEITNSMTPCSFEPVVDYVVTKIPKFNFNKFPNTEPSLDTQMKSVGEVMGIGRSFQESLHKALQSLESDISGLDNKLDLSSDDVNNILVKKLQMPSWDRIWYIADAFRLGYSSDQVYALTKIDKWFLWQIKELIDTENELIGLQLSDMDYNTLYKLKSQGFADQRIAKLLRVNEEVVRYHRHCLSIKSVYKRVDSCAAEFATTTAYLYSTYEEENEIYPTSRQKIIILGSGPNRIGQGLEFDYCCVHASLALREAGYETIMINSNPETVSTDYDSSDRLYFEPLTLEHILEIVYQEKPLGVIVQFGGQTPLKLAQALQRAGVQILGTQPDIVNQTEDRVLFQQLMRKLSIPYPPSAIVYSKQQAIELNKLYPIIIRPSYVLGGGDMCIFYNQQEFSHYLTTTNIIVSNNNPLLIEHFLDNAIEVDVDAVCDGQDVLIGGIMEHIEPAGIHSGDSICSLPSYSLDKSTLHKIRNYVIKITTKLNILGSVNMQFAIKGDDVFVLEVNSRAARTVPFVAKATGIQLAKIASLCIIGITLKEQGYTTEFIPSYFSVKMPVFPFAKFIQADHMLGPEMKSTGEVIGIHQNFSHALLKAYLACGYNMFKPRKILIISYDDQDNLIKTVQVLNGIGVKVIVSKAIAMQLNSKDIQFEQINVKNEVDCTLNLIRNGYVNLVINIQNLPSSESIVIRHEAFIYNVLYIDAIRVCHLICNALNTFELKVSSIQNLLTENSL